MTIASLHFQLLGSKGLIINFQDFIISQKEIQKQWHFRNTLLEVFGSLLNDIVMTSHAITLLFKKELRDVENIQQQVLNAYKATNVLTSSFSYKEWKIPVCFDAEYGADLHHYFEGNERAVKRYLNTFMKSKLWVHHYGFLPGFCYLSGLDVSLQLKRKSKPALRVPKGAVAVGGSYAGLYPQESPGGWQLIGRTFVNLFNTQSNKPCFATPGDVFTFESISKEMYLEVIESSINLPIPSYTTHHD